MFKKTLFAVFGLGMALAFATPERAQAGVAIGVAVGGPVVVPAYRPYVYVPPVPCPPPVVYAPPYAYGGPVVYGRYYGRPYWRHEAYERHEWREHEWRERHWDRR